MKAGAFALSWGHPPALPAGPMLAPANGDTKQETIRTAHHEFAVAPHRARAPAETSATRTNSGTETPTASAADGSWTTGEIAPDQSVSRFSGSPAPAPAPPSAATIRGRLRS